MEQAWIQLIMTAGAVISSLMVTIRFMSKQNAKRERQTQEYHENMQKMQYEYYETKNGHMERMAKDFTKASNKMSTAVGKLSSEIKVLSSKHK